MSQKDPFKDVPHTPMRAYIPAKDPLRSIPPSRHPFQFWAMIACAASGLGNMITGSTSIVYDLLPAYSVKIWGTSLFISGVLALISAFLSDRITGLLLERIALSGVLFATLIYGVVVLYLAGTGALIPGFLSIGISVAAGWRIVHATREIYIIQNMLSWMSGDDD